VNEKKYVYKSTLSKEFGLSPSLIDEIGEPDKFVPNPHYRSGPEASLYAVERVEQWIQANQDRVDEARAARAKRSESARRVHEKRRSEKRVKALDWVRHVPLEIDALPEDLLSKAQKHYGLRKQIHIRTEKGLLAFVRRYLSNYGRLRSEISDHDWWVQDELYAELRSRIDNETKRRLVKWEEANANQE
jgi:hypothetical protein